MMIEGSTILVADDERAICEMLQDLLEPAGARVRLAHTGDEALALLEAEEPDLAILDIRMPAPDGLAVLQQIREQGNDIPVIMVTAQESSTLTIEAMQHGAYDYIRKPFNPDDVLLVVERALEYRHLTHRVRTLEQQTGKLDPRDTLIGQSAAMQQVYKLVGRVATSNVTVLITGESGTGKELVARVIHTTSARSRKPFVAVNCAALPETLLESELFGHEKGAFTGAMAQRKGRFEQANRGTIFLDEVGETSLGIQKKLLRVLQERTFTRVGGNVEVKTDVRILAATNRTLEHDVAEGRFREDLYYRLNVINIHMPPLRERVEDIPLLVQHFLAQQPGQDDARPLRITQEALDHLLTHAWPGNIRQLQNTIERAAVLAHGRLIEPAHLMLPDDEGDNADPLTAALDVLLEHGETLDSVLERVWQQMTRRALQYSGNDTAVAAQRLGISPDDLADHLTGAVLSPASGDAARAPADEQENGARPEGEEALARYHTYINLLLNHLSEPQRRWCAAVLSYEPDGPSIRKLAHITGLSSSTIMRGRREVAAQLADMPQHRQRREGGGRPASKKKRGEAHGNV
jgi:DNA-binding NtrC family response regulator